MLRPRGRLLDDALEPEAFTGPSRTMLARPKVPSPTPRVFLARGGEDVTSERARTPSGSSSREEARRVSFPESRFHIEHPDPCLSPPSRASRSLACSRSSQRGTPRTIPKARPPSRGRARKRRLARSRRWRASPWCSTRGTPRTRRSASRGAWSRRTTTPWRRRPSRSARASCASTTRKRKRKMKKTETVSDPSPAPGALERRTPRRSMWWRWWTRTRRSSRRTTSSESRTP